MINRKIFFDEYRAKIDPDRRLTQTEVDALEVFLAMVDRHISYFEMNQWAYVFATVFHETGATFLPLRERGNNRYLTQLYDITGARPQIAKKNGNTQRGDGIKYSGKGYVQITWKNNYAKYAQKLEIPLVEQPDLALLPKVAFFILIDGLKNGVFTGKKISDYINRDRTDYRNARRCVNLMDRADLIASYARTFENILRKSINRILT